MDIRQMYDDLTAFDGTINLNLNIDDLRIDGTLLTDNPRDALIQLQSIIEKHGGQIVSSEYSINIGIVQYTITASVPFMRPTANIEPDPMPIPATLSSAALTFLNRLCNGADIRVFWHRRCPTPTIDGNNMPTDLWTAFQTELTRKTLGKFFDGYSWLEYTVNQAVYTKSIETLNEEWGIEFKIELNDAGLAFVEQTRMPT